MVVVKQPMRTRSWSRDDGGVFLLRNLQLRTFLFGSGLMILVLWTTVSQYNSNDGLLLMFPSGNTSSATTDKSSLLVTTTRTTTGYDDDDDDKEPFDMNAEMAAAKDYVRSIQKLDRRLVFFHIPKTAGTAIESAAGTKHIPWGSCLFNHKPKRDICRYPDGKQWPGRVGWWHLPSQLFPLANANPYQNAELFGVIRNPYDRMVSEFYYICTLRVFDWRPDQCDRSRLFDQDYMNEWLTKKLQNRQRETGRGYALDNGHFTPQYEFIFAPHQVRMLDYVLTMEGSRRGSSSLADDFHRLMDAFGLEHVRLEKVHALGAAAREKETHYLDVDDLNSDTLQWIHDMYPDDLALGGYDDTK